VTREEAERESTRRMSVLATFMINGAMCDLLPGWVAPEEEPDPVKRALCAHGGLTRLAALGAKQRLEERESMKAAYEWFMSDSRLLYRLPADVVLKAGDESEVDAWLPFLVACEAVSREPDRARDVMRRGLEEWKLTPEVVLHPEVPVLNETPLLPKVPKVKKPKVPKVKKLTALSLTRRILDSFRLKR
jgi:hypothetical protein